MSEVRLSIPAVKSAIFLTLDNLNLPRALLSKKITLGTFPQTITLALRLLDSFVPKRAFHSHTSIKDPTLHQDLAWILNGIERLWRITHRWARTSMDDIEIKSRISIILCSQQLFTILPQVVARICHPHATVYELLTRIVAKVANAFPQQGLWTVLAVVKSSSKDRASRGINCLHKITGLTFEKPELVPFRLTQNMIDAFGAYGYNGPFRRTCEISLRLLRQNEDALMTVLETFLHDPTTDFIGKKQRTREI
ncbi:hypothetical protein EMGR_002870 [Emarellia grisea]